jgi:hypothetical protein
MFAKNDPELHTKVLIFPYELSAENPDVVTIYSDDPRMGFESVRFCRLPPPVLRFAAVCTQNWKTTKEQVLDWVAWHRAHGFDQAILYMNQYGGVDFMKPLLTTAVRHGSWFWLIGLGRSYLGFMTNRPRKQVAFGGQNKDLNGLV